MTKDIGSILAGKYEVLRLLGEGASGAVYLVRHTDLNVEYALKLLDPTLAVDEKFIDRFKREAGLLTKFQHAGCAQLRDFGRTEDGRYYMTMDFCDGVLLKDIILSEAPFDSNRACNLMIQMLAVLEAAHKVGIIHRDIKPENMMIVKGLDGEEIVKLLDFGIARLREEVQGEKAMTVEGASIGTPQYMSPEQAAGEKDLDSRVDIYACGIVLYEMLSGTQPFKGNNLLHTLLMQLTQPPPPFPEGVNVSTDIEVVLLKALEKKRDFRYSTAGEFLSGLKNAISGDEIVDAVNNRLRSVGKIDWAEGDAPRILCLDDQEMIVNILKHILESEGYSVKTATEWSVLSGMLFSDPVDLLVTDVEMPGMKGTAICKILKQAAPKLKIALFSAVPERDLEKLAAECGADAWISKSWKPKEWLEKVKTLV